LKLRVEGLQAENERQHYAALIPTEIPDKIESPPDPKLEETMITDMTAPPTGLFLIPPPRSRGRVGWGRSRVEEESVKRLRCRECGRLRDFEPAYVCEDCFGPLEVAYDLEAIRERVSRHTIADGPPSIWRYRELLPAPPANPVDLGTGFTPLVEAKNVGEALGLDHLYVKNDTLNPTGSFKDR